MFEFNQLKFLFLIALVEVEDDEVLFAIAQEVGKLV